MKAFVKNSCLSLIAELDHDRTNKNLFTILRDLERSTQLCTYVIIPIVSTAE